MSKVTKEAALEYHKEPRPGKIEVIPTKPYSSQQDLALAYSPGVAYPCKEIQANAEDAYEYTDKGNLVGVISNGTAVLGLGDIGALAGKPVMEGKALLFKIFAGIDCFDIEIDEKDPQKFINIVKALTPTFGGINLEDIKAPECFEIETKLKEQCDIPIMHDDQHGTAIISAAGLLNALEIQDKKIEDVRLVVNGAGAAAVSCTRLYISLGVKKENVVMCDSKGVISTSRTNLNRQKAEFATSRPITTLAEAMVDADVFLGLSVKDVVTPEMLKSMAPKPIVFALANPDPEINYEKAMASRDDLIFATGRSDYPNQINNVIGFPYIFRGALDVRSTSINEEMKIAAVYAIAALAKQPVPSVVNSAYNMLDLKFGRDYILPKPLDPRLLTSVAPAVAKAAMESGVARKKITDWKQYNERLQHIMGYDNKLLRQFIEQAQCDPQRVVFGEANTDNMLRAAVEAYKENICVPILLGNEEMIEKRAQRLGIDISGIEIVNLRNDREADRRARYAEVLAKKGQREGMTYQEALELMMDRNHFGMMMVVTGDADAMIAGTYAGYEVPAEVARKVVGIRPSFSHFATMHILNTKKGIYYLADTMVNNDMDEQALLDVTRLVRNSVEYFGQEPIMAMVSFSNFGSSKDKESAIVHNVVEKMHNMYPDLAIDGEMQAHYAIDSKSRDALFPFNRLKGKEVNTLVFPNLSTASTAYRLLATLGVGETIGPIQMGLNNPIHFIKVDAPVRDIVTLATVASIDASVQCKMGGHEHDH